MLLRSLSSSRPAFGVTAGAVAYQLPSCLDQLIWALIGANPHFFEPGMLKIGTVTAAFTIGPGGNDREMQMQFDASRLMAFGVKYVVTRKERGDRSRAEKTLPVHN